ncbi:hypothetical protein EON77_11440 [bacterium]|nr:MAG: hypothetical protein EON77_11440 [bacterium]
MSAAPTVFHEAVQTVYFDDFDAFRILHNSRYLLFVERTIGSFWSRLGWTGIMSVDGNPDAITTVELGDPALRDFDTPESLVALR